MAYTSKERLKIINSITVKGLVVNVFLIVIKFFAGITGKSSAMIADAVHSISDLITDIVVLAGASIASKPKDHNHHFGHGKVETLSTAFVGSMLFGAGIYIFISGIQLILLFLKGNIIEKPNMIAFYIAIVSIITKEIIYRYTIHSGKKVNSSMLIANAWHHRSDALTSIGTLLGIGGAIFLGDAWLFLDPLAAVVVSVFIFKLSIKLTSESIKELIETALPNKTEKEIQAISNKVAGVIEPHSLKTRRIGNNIAIEMHIYVNENLSIIEAHNITIELEKQLKIRFGEGTFISIHPEPLSIKENENEAT